MSGRLLQHIYEDDYLIAINKPARMATVPAEHVPLFETALGKMERQFEDKGIKPYVLHRLDAETSGVLLFGKHKRDRAELEKIFRGTGGTATRKVYVALVKGAFKGGAHGTARSGIITAPLPARAGGEKVPAHTSYKVIDIFSAPPPARGPLCTLVEAEIKTGRRHQIRQHFAGIGNPIVMDSRYGDPQFNRKFRLRYRLGRQFLHAFKISFNHPLLKKTVEVSAPLPADLVSVLKKLE